MAGSSQSAHLTGEAGVLASGYDPLPRYRVVDGRVSQGWADAVAGLPPGLRTLGVDGPVVLDWSTLTRSLTTALSVLGPVVAVDMQDNVRPWAEVLELTRSSPQLADDPDFATLAAGTLADLLDPAALKALADAPDEATVGLRLLVGPGAALCHPDVLWWADLPKRYAEAAVSSGTGRNLAQPASIPATTKRLFYVDWPLLDRHRDQFATRVDRWIDTQGPGRPTSVEGAALRSTCAQLARRPFRTRPTFNTTPWGGHWAQLELGHNTNAKNTALGYELIAPESGVLLGERADRVVEVPFQLIVALSPDDVLGPLVHEAFGTSFPIRFDYLDTLGGGNLSVHCHPQAEYMREVFGWPYTQHETYYMMVGGENGKVFLGLREDASVPDFHRRANDADAHGTQFDIEQFVQTFPATPHQLFLVPAGTPHGSSAGNVVLEVSATPYLYSLRFYDWLRRDSTERQRSVHVEHAFRNLDTNRTGSAVADRLLQEPRTLGEGNGWSEELLGALAEMFFEVRRLVVAAGARADQDTEGRFHVLTVVEGGPGMIETKAGDRHPLAYAETLAVPAATGAYTVHNHGTATLRLVKAHVR